MLLTSDLDKYFTGLESQDAFSGVVLITRGAETLFTGAYGWASRAWRVKNTLEMRFDTASVTKLFTAVATLQQVDAGRLSLDTSAVETLGLTGTTVSPAVTVRHLLTHTSGIADDADEEADESYEALWKERPNYSVTEAADFLPQFVHKPPNFAPGQGCRYCNVGYILLGLLVEKVTGQAFRDYVGQNVFAPAGMNRSGFFRFDQVAEEVAEGADPVRGGDGLVSGWRRNIYSYPPIGTPDGGAHVTAADLRTFLRSLQAGRLLSSELTGAFLKPQVFYKQREAWAEYNGYGLWFALDRAEHVLFYEKEGINAGTSAILRHYPDTDLTVVLLSNLQEGVWAPMRHIHLELMAQSPLDGRIYPTKAV